MPREQVSLPSTRYVGSKRRIASWIWNRIKDLDFDVFLDAFGGTGVVGYCAKRHDKKVLYNDVLRFNYQIGLAIIENSSTTLSRRDIEFLLGEIDDVDYPSFIQNTFKGIYYTDEENRWLDAVVTNIKLLEDAYKRALAFSALGQACLMKRPFNLFHRGNLHLRLRDVERGFRNKTTWDTPFPVLFERLVDEYNSLVFCNGRENRAYNADVFDLALEEDVDLVYLDPPYLRNPKRGPDYHRLYHFLEGLVRYRNWSNMIDWDSKIREIRHRPSPWVRRETIYDAFDRLFRKFRDVGALVVSYRSDGIPSPQEILGMLRRHKGHVELEGLTHKYVLSRRRSRELLFIAY